MRSSRYCRSRRSFLRDTAVLALTSAAATLAVACGPAATPSPSAPPKSAASTTSQPSLAKPTAPAAAPQPAAKSAPSKETVTIRFFTGEDDPPQIKVYKDIIAEYEKAHPNVTISVSPAPDDILQKLTAAIAAKTAPEFSTLVEAEIMELAARGFLQPVDDVVREIGPEDFKPNSLYTIRGKVYNLPYAGGGYGQVWYRTDLFEKAGLQPSTTWDEWKTAAQQLTKDGVYGFTTPGHKGGSLNVFISQLIWSSGGTFFDEKLNVAIDGKSHDAIRQALEFYKEMTAFAPPGWQQYDWDGTIDSFLSKKAAMIFYAGRPLGRAADSVPDLVPVMKAFPLPKSRAGYVGHYDHYDSYAAFKKEFGSHDPETTLDFIKFLISGDNAVNFLHTVPGHLSPPLFSIEENPKFWEHPLMKSHRDSVELVFRPGGIYYLNEAGAKPNAQGIMETVGIFNLYAGPPTARSVHAEMAQRLVLQNQPVDQAIKWAADEFTRMSDDLKKRIKPEEFGYQG